MSAYPSSSRPVPNVNILFVSDVVDVDVRRLLKRIAFVLCALIGKILVIAVTLIHIYIHVSQLVNKICSHCLFPVVKSRTSCYHLVMFSLCRDAVLCFRNL